MPSEKTRQTGWALRIYKNSDNKVLAMDDIAVVTDTRRISATNFHHSSRWTSKRTLIELSEGTRVVSKILMLGDFDSYTNDSGNYKTATWNAVSENENSVTMTFEDLPEIGDTL